MATGATGWSRNTMSVAGRPMTASSRADASRPACGLPRLPSQAGRGLDGRGSAKSGCPSNRRMADVMLASRRAGRGGGGGGSIAERSSSGTIQRTRGPRAVRAMADVARPDRGEEDCIMSPYSGIRPPVEEGCGRGRCRAGPTGDDPDRSVFEPGQPARRLGRADHLDEFGTIAEFVPPARRERDLDDIVIA